MKDNKTIDLEIHAEQAHHQDLEAFLRIYPKVIDVMKRKATYDFCIRRINTLEKNVKSSHFLTSFKFIWYLFSTIAALLNVKSAYLVSPGDWDFIRMPIAILISFALVFGADWVISTETVNFKARRQSKSINKQHD